MIYKVVYHFLHLPVFIVAKLLLRYKAIGTEHIPKKGSAILASNHASYLDPPLVGVGVWRRINYLAKKELFNSSIVSFIFKKFFMAIPIDRTQMERSTLRSIYQLLGKNEILLMFPEGTRTYDGKLMEPKLGIGMVVYHTQVPVIPVYIQGSFDIWSRNLKFMRLRRCAVFFGPPVDLKPYYKKKKSKGVYQEISEKIMEDIHKLEQKADEKMEVSYKESLRKIAS